MSALYTGTVRHRRFAPRAHGFTYPVFMALLDLDRLSESMAVSKLLGFNRFAWAGYDDRDHLGDPSLPLKARFRSDAESQGFTFPEGRVLLLANLRFWGYCFNPVSYVYAYDQEDRLTLIGAEVCNTPWKERIMYWMRVPLPEAHADDEGFERIEPGSAESRTGATRDREGLTMRVPLPEARADGGDSTVLSATAPSRSPTRRQGWSFDIPKAMHVSPFMPMDLRYRWSFTAPDDDLKVRMALFEGAALIFDVDLDMDRRDWSPAAIRRTLLAYPFHTLKVITAIHWEALKLWLKRVPIFTHPAKA